MKQCSVVAAHAQSDERGGGVSAELLGGLEGRMRKGQFDSKLALWEAREYLANQAWRWRGKVCEVMARDYYRFSSAPTQ
jgi:hypothetical protein